MIIKIGKNKISNTGKTYFVADIAANHDGSLSRAKKLIKLCAKAGANAAKFQHFKAETIVSDKGFKVYKRAEVLGMISKQSYTIAVAGTHGKTTTSAFLTHIFSENSQVFTSIMGGFFKDQKSNLITQGDDFMIVEADEYDRSFLQLYPAIACITSMDPDHLDVYETDSSFSEAFIQFSSQVSQALVVAYGLPVNGITYGINVPADYRVENIIKNKFGYNFNIITPLRTYKNVYLNQLGIHNISNALCAIAMADQVGIFPENSIKALTTFPGVQRRMNLMKYGDAIIIDDYAHHPTEIENVLENYLYPEFLLKFY